MVLRNTILAVGAAMVLGVGARSPNPAQLEAEGEVTGNVLVAGLETKNRGPVIIFLVDEADRADGPNGKADRAFVLQVRKGETDGLNGHIMNANVKWTQSSVDIRRDGVDVLSLALNNADLASGGSVKRGYGLAHLAAGDFLLRKSLLEGTDLDAVITRLKQKLDEAECECVAGGSGSVKCSVSGCPAPPTGCTVTCESGRVPCCGCIRLNPGKEPPQMGSSCCGCPGSNKK